MAHPIARGRCQMASGLHTTATRAPACLCMADRELPCPLSLWLLCYQMVKVMTSRNNSKHLRGVQHPVFLYQCRRTGVLHQANVNFSCLSRTTHGDTEHLPLLSSYSMSYCHCLCFPSISPKFLLKLSTKSFTFQDGLQPFK